MTYPLYGYNVKGWYPSPMNQYRVIGNGYIGATNIIGVAQYEGVIGAIWGGYLIGASYGGYIINTLCVMDTNRIVWWMQLIYITAISFSHHLDL